jgi:hypothetical protein
VGLAFSTLKNINNYKDEFYRVANTLAYLF